MKDGASDSAGAADCSEDAKPPSKSGSFSIFAPSIPNDPRGSDAQGKQGGWMDMIMGDDASRVFGAVAGAVGRECNKDLADTITGAIRNSLLSPVMDRVMRDVLPYLWCLGGLLTGLIILCAAQLIVSLLVLYRSSR